MEEWRLQDSCLLGVSAQALRNLTQFIHVLCYDNRAIFLFAIYFWTFQCIILVHFSPLLCQNTIVLIVIRLWYDLKSETMMQPPVFLRTVEAIWILTCFSINLEIIFIFVWRIPLGLQQGLCKSVYYFEWYTEFRNNESFNQWK